MKDSTNTLYIYTRVSASGQTAGKSLNVQKKLGIGKAKSLGSDGAFLEYDIKVVHQGEKNSRTAIHTKFRLDNQFASYPAGTCLY